MKKRPFCTLSRKHWLCLKNLVMEFSKKLACTNNKKSILETLYLELYPELGKIKMPTKFMKFALKQNGSLQASPMQIEGRELFPLQTYCCSKASICHATGNAMVKIWVCFFLSIFLQNEERVRKNGLFALLEESNAFV